jgi:hypothetical protein
MKADLDEDKARHIDQEVKRLEARLEKQRKIFKESQEAKKAAISDQKILEKLEKEFETFDKKMEKEIEKEQAEMQHKLEAEYYKKFSRDRLGIVRDVILQNEAVLRGELAEDLAAFSDEVGWLYLICGCHQKGKYGGRVWRRQFHWIIVLITYRI